MNLKELIQNKREIIIKIAAQHGAYNVRLFGSVARGEETENSDIDLLVDLGDNLSPWFPSGLIRELESILARKVDLATENSLKPRIKEKILNDVIKL